jgi:hypothetical protein
MSLVATVGACAGPVGREGRKCQPMPAARGCSRPLRRLAVTVTYRSIPSVPDRLLCSCMLVDRDAVVAHDLQVLHIALVRDWRERWVPHVRRLLDLRVGGSGHVGRLLVRATGLFLAPPPPHPCCLASCKSPTSLRLKKEKWAVTAVRVLAGVETAGTEQAEDVSWRQRNLRLDSPPRTRTA